MVKENWFETLAERYWLMPDDTGEDEAQLVIRTLRLRKGQTVLDAPCGAGRIAVHLAAYGCRVTGVDLRRKFVDRARSRFQNSGLVGQFSVADLRAIEWDRDFDAIINWGGSFGYFSDAENVRVMQLYAQSLRKGGRILVDQLNREYILRNFVHERRDGNRLTRNSWDKKRQRVESRRFVNGKARSGCESSMRLYTPAQTRRLFERAGLTVEGLFDGHTGGTLCRTSSRMIAVGRRT